MIGHFNGCAAVIQPLVILIHRHKLFLSRACEIPEIRNCSGIFFQGGGLSNNNRRHCLRSLCPARWMDSQDAVFRKRSLGARKSRSEWQVENSKRCIRSPCSHSSAELPHGAEFRSLSERGLLTGITAHRRRLYDGGLCFSADPVEEKKCFASIFRKTKSLSQTTWALEPLCHQVYFYPVCDDDLLSNSTFSSVRRRKAWFWKKGENMMINFLFSDTSFDAWRCSEVNESDIYSNIPL